MFALAPLAKMVGHAPMAKKTHTLVRVWVVGVAPIAKLDLYYVHCILVSMVGLVIVLEEIVYWAHHAYVLQDLVVLCVFFDLVEKALFYSLNLIYSLFFVSKIFLV